MCSFTRFLIGCASGAALLFAANLAQASSRVAADGSRLVVIRGSIVCVDESGVVKDCDVGNTQLALKSSDGGLYLFRQTDPQIDPMFAMIADHNVRSKELQITGMVNTSKQLEVIKIQSVKQGRLYDLYYFCEICNITRYAPGLCPCCRGELELRETPAPEP